MADNKDGTLTEEQVKYARAILSSNNDLLALINDILDLSRIEAGHVELSDEVVVVDSALQRLRETFEPMARQKGLALQIEADALAPSQLVVDSQRLQQILKNLLANAVKFTEHGKVSLHVRAAGNGRIRFEVCDTGIGIAREQLDVIFEAFRQADGSTRRRYGGTGLGLSISRDLAERMGGQIQVDSERARQLLHPGAAIAGRPAASAARAAEAPWQCRRRHGPPCRPPGARCHCGGADHRDGVADDRAAASAPAPDPGGRGRCHVRRSTGGPWPMNWTSTAWWRVRRKSADP